MEAQLNKVEQTRSKLGHVGVSCGVVEAIPENIGEKIILRRCACKIEKFYIIKFVLGKKNIIILAYKYNLP